MFSIYKKEISAFFSNATGYIVIGIFLLATGLFLWVIPGNYNILDSGYANTDGLFQLAPWLFLFLCPAITMRLFAEEYQTGTWELLITKPVGKWSLAAGKYLAGLTVAVIALLPCILYYFTVGYIAEPEWNVDSGAFWGSFAGLIFLCVEYVAIGSFASSLSKNQIIAFIVAVILCFFMLYGFDLASSFFQHTQTAHIIELLGINAHYQSMSRGVIDSRDVAYFLLVAAIFILLTVWKIGKK